MTDSDMSHLARHLGHDAKTHKEFYRLSASTIQLSKVGCIVTNSFGYVEIFICYLLFADLTTFYLVSNSHKMFQIHLL